MPGQQPQHPPTLDYQTPQAITWRPNWKSTLVNTCSLAFYALLILALFAAGFRFLP